LAALRPQKATARDRPLARQPPEMLPPAEHATRGDAPSRRRAGARRRRLFKGRAHSVGIFVSVCPVPLASTENHRTELGVSHLTRKPDAQSAIWRSSHPALSPRIHAARSNGGRRMGGRGRAPLHATLEFGQEMIAKHRPVGWLVCGICGDDSHFAVVCCPSWWAGAEAVGPSSGGVTA
jgi:hypothetical protein